jgi:hypothetical protein
VGELVRQFTVSIPAGTAKATPVTINIPIGNFEIESIELEVPPGQSRLMGFYLALSGQQVIPYDAGEYLVWDNQEKSWPLTNQVTTGRWQVVGYNTGSYPHRVIVRFHVNSLGDPPPPPSPQVTIISQPLAGSTTIL